VKPSTLAAFESARYDRWRLTIALYIGWLRAWPRVAGPTSPVATRGLPIEYASERRTAMAKLIYSMGVSLDGFVADTDGSIDWGGPDEELHRFHNEQVRELGAQVMGRRLYETMLYWETVDRSSSEPEHMIEIEFAEIWKPLPKLVFSRTLDQVEGNARLATGDVAEEVARIKEESDGDVGVGGAELASACIELGLVDEYRPFVYPIALGRGIPFFPPLDERIPMRLVESREFGMGVVYLRYEAVRA
jgi:dihydrofolate reductase